MPACRTTPIFVKYFCDPHKTGFLVKTCQELYVWISFLPISTIFSHKTVRSIIHYIYFIHPIFRFRFLVTFGNEVTKIRNFYVIFVYILQGKMGKTEKNRKEYHTTKVTKIPKTNEQNIKAESGRFFECYNQI